MKSSLAGDPQNRKNPSRAPFRAPARSTQAARTQATRRRLLAAAESIFARDGFEAARLEDIAASAGYTRGAFYANFKSKEDIFFVLFEEWIRKRIDAVTALLRRYKNPADKLAALRKFYAETPLDRRFVLIAFEFKIFALRHPDAHARLRDRHRRLRVTGGKLFSELLEPLGRSLPVANPAAVTCLGALAQALLLDHLVDAKTLTGHDIRRVQGLFFDSIFGVALPRVD